MSNDDYRVYAYGVPPYSYTDRNGDGCGFLGLILLAMLTAFLVMAMTAKGG